MIILGHCIPNLNFSIELKKKLCLHLYRHDIGKKCLMQNVYPKIKDYCREKHGLEFQVWSKHGIKL